MMVCACTQGGEVRLQNGSVSNSLPPRQRLEMLLKTTPEYRKEALRLVIAEANQVARSLDLPEQLPIAEKDLIEAYISTPGMAQQMQALGNITTSNYVYYVSVGCKFSFLTKRNLARDYANLRAEYLWPMSSMDTNAAFRLATNFMRAVSMDVQGLNRDCSIQIRAYSPEGATGQHFVPLYWVSWILKDENEQACVAMVEVFEPTKCIRQLRVEDSKYILRKPLRVKTPSFPPADTNLTKSIIVYTNQ